MRSTELKEFIQQHSSLFWYTPEDKKQDISDEALVETILNYGTMNDVYELINLFSMNKTANLFFSSINTSERRRSNYNEITINYFTYFFNKHAQGDFQLKAN